MPLSTKKLKELADAQVPKHLQGLGRVLPAAPQVATAARAGSNSDDDLLGALAGEVGVELKADDDKVQSVAYEDNTDLGKRAIVVMISTKTGKVVNVVKTA